jgi:hypothetical protein
MQKLRLKRYLEVIDPQLVKPGLKHDRNSPLFQPATETKKRRDLTTHNLLIRKMRWATFLPHLKWVAACKAPWWFVRVVNDKTLMHIWLGNTNVRARKLQESADDLLVANSIDDHLGGPDLVIIRLGTIVHANKAAANVLAETLRMRASLDKPTWLVEPEDQEFRPFSRNEFGLSEGMVVCGESTLEFVTDHFRKIKLKTTVEVEEEESDYYEDEDGNITLGEDGLDEEGVAVEGLPELEEEEDEEDDEEEEEVEVEVEEKKPARKASRKVATPAPAPVDDFPPLWEESDQAKKKGWRR